jgi:thioredoxin-like negative regulator of GroEL
MTHRGLTLWIIFLTLMATLPITAEDAVLRAAEGRLNAALEDGLSPADFAAIRAITGNAYGLPDWSDYATMLARLESARPMDPLIRSVLREHRSQLLQALGDVDRSHALFAAGGGLTQWWVHGPEDIEELADFGDLARLPDDGWRPAPGTDPDGWVALAGLGWPARRQMLVLATTVESPRDQPVALRLGAAQVARAWINGEVVLTTDHPLAAAEDQVAAGAWLRAGRNTVAIAVASENDAWWLRARLTAPDGSDLQGLREINQAPGETEPLDRPVPDIRTMEAVLREAAERETPGAAVSLAAWLVDRPPYPPGSGDARAACVAARDDDAAMALALEASISDDSARRRELLAEALAAGADPLPVRMDLARWYHDRGLWSDARTTLGAIDEAVVLESTALVFAVERWGSLALEPLTRFAETHPTSLDTNLSLAEMAHDLGRPVLRDRAMEAVRAMAPAHPHLMSLEAEVAEACGDADAVESLVRWDLTNDPNRVDARITAALLALADDREDDARSLLRDGLERSPDDVDLRLELARLEHRVGHDDRAVETALAVLETRPQERRAEELLKLLGAFASDTSWVAPPEALWAMADQADHLTGPSVVLLDRTEIRVLPDNLTEERFQRAFLVRDAQRSESLQVHHLPYVRESQRMRVLAARILRRDGSEASAVQRDTPRLSEPEFNIYYDTRLRRLRFPELEDGDIVEITYVLTETVESNDTGAYKGGLISLGHPSPVLRADIALSAPEGELPAWELGNLEGNPDRTLGARAPRPSAGRWRDLPALAPDMPRPPDLVVQPHLVVLQSSRTGETWRTGTAATSLHASASPPSWRPRLGNSSSGATTRDAKIARIYRYVADQIRYVSLAFGEHRYPSLLRDLGDRAWHRRLQGHRGAARGALRSGWDPGPHGHDPHRRSRPLATRDRHPGGVQPRHRLPPGRRPVARRHGERTRSLPPSGHGPSEPGLLVVDGRGRATQDDAQLRCGRFSYDVPLERATAMTSTITIRTEDVGEAATIRREPLRREPQSAALLALAARVSSLAPNWSANPSTTSLRACGWRQCDIDGAGTMLALTASGGLRTFPGEFELVESTGPHGGTLHAAPRSGSPRPGVDHDDRHRPTRREPSGTGEARATTSVSSKSQWRCHRRRSRDQGRFRLRPQRWRPPTIRPSPIPGGGATER